MTDVVLWEIEPLGKRELITLRETLRRIGLMKFVKGEGYTLHRMCYCYIVGKRQYLCHAKQFRALKRGNQPIPELDEDEKSKLISVGKYTKSCLAMYMVEFDILKNHPEILADYYKRLRIPGAVKYAREMKKLFARIFGEG